MIRDANSILDLLAYLHDAKCAQMTWDCTNQDVRSLRMLVTVDREADYPPWEGKKLCITLSDVVFAYFKAFGFVLGDENIDDWRQGVSEDTEQECRSLLADHIVVPPLKFSISFRSGSILEVVCAEVSAVETS